MSRMTAISQPTALARTAPAGGIARQGYKGSKAASVIAELDFLATMLDPRWRIPGI